MVSLPILANTRQKGQLQRRRARLRGMGFGLNIGHNRAVPLPARETQTNAAITAARRVE
jgi:hypothetical protein